MIGKTVLSSLQRNGFSKKRLDAAPLTLLYASAVLYCFLCLHLSISPIGSSAYNTYTLQALAWREGRLSLGMDYPHLELAVYGGDWYVSFPPVPAIPLYLLTFLFGSNTPDNLLVKIYLTAGCIVCYRMLSNAGFKRSSAVIWALFLSFATSLLSLSTNGAVWYQAQTLAFLLTMASAALMFGDRPTGSLFLCALAVGCRPFNALYVPLMLLLYFVRAKSRGKTLQKAIRHILPGLALGLLTACAYGLYNWVRFQNPLEFGHSYLPEFSTQGGVQFSLDHILPNIKTFLFGWAFPDGNLTIFGFSMFLVHPILLLLPVWAIVDLMKKRFTLLKGCTLFLFVLHLFFLLLHRTFGGYQFGARYTADLLPYAAVYLALGGRKRDITPAEIAIFIPALAFAVYGACSIVL